MASEAQKKATSRYNREHSRYISLKFNMSNPEDAKIYDHLSGMASRQGYIKRLVLEDMGRH